MERYSTKELSNLAGVSVRTLHYYDQIGLLKPAIRTEANYRFYGKNELLKLQQILFYKALNFSLKEIMEILNDPDFDLIKALESHQQALLVKQDQITEMLNTIDKTILNLKDKTMLSNEDLYKGFSSEEADKIRQEAIKKYGKEVEKSEQYLKNLTKTQIEKLKQEQKDIFKRLSLLTAEAPDSETVQKEIALHYQNIRKFWGTHNSSDSQKEQYKGLGKLYISDERFVLVDGKYQPKFAEFISKAMSYFVDSQLE